MRRVVGLILSMVVLVGCQRTAPQRPTFHGTQQADTTTLQLLSMNQRMADEADRQLVGLAGEGYVLMEENYWVKGLKACTDTIAEGEYISLEAKIYDLKGSLLTTHQVDAQAGKLDEIQAIVYVMDKMRRNNPVTMLVPWYLAFGSAGNQEVRPYENVRIELLIK